MPFDFGIGEIAIVLVIGLLVFGPKKLPEISRGIGSGMRDFRRGLAGEADPTPAETPVADAAAPVAAEAVVSETVAPDAPAQPPVVAATAAATAPPMAAAAAASDPAPAPPAE
ncbi:MAG: twin-arginine translocase TatA/TatE family subunit [Actinobacteria bacterium]|nr:twin-arginine translocase TatA/TatE family subunit [Actinomycetota bacterium]